MSASYRSQRTRRAQRQALPATHPTCPGPLTPRDRVTVFVVILVVVITLMSAGKSVLDALGVVMVVGGAAAQISSWLSEQRLLASAPGNA